jgi:protein-disulfide isomerase
MVSDGMIMSRRTLLTVSSLVGVSFLAGQSQARVLRLASEISNEIFNLPGRIVLGNPKGDVTMVEFFDYNCGFCKQTSREVRPLLASDPDLRYILVNYAVLGEASIEASRIALASTMQKTKGGYLALHEELFKLRGRVGAQRALDVAVTMGADGKKLINDADSDRITDALVKSSRLGENLGLTATPSFVAGREAVVGYVDLPSKKKAIANLRRCEALAC